MQQFLVFAWEDFEQGAGLQDLAGVHTDLDESVRFARFTHNRWDSAGWNCDIWTIRGVVPELVLEIRRRYDLIPPSVIRQAVRTEVWSPNWKDIGTAEYSRPEVCVGPI